MTATDATGEPRRRHGQCLDGRGLHRMAYWQWERAGGGADRVLLCAHGLSRQGRDFDVLARAMQDGWRVICPDVVGRGESDRLADPSSYQITTYVADMVTLLARLDATTVHWFGTSMGGLIGMALAALPGSPIERLVLNDVGPAVDPAGIARIGAYVGLPLTWASEDEAADYLLTISKGFGPHDRAQWMALTRPMLRREGDGWRLHYDPAIGVPLRAMTPAAAAAGEAALWAAYDAIRCPTLVLRGAESDVLSAATARAMAERGPKARVHEFAGVGHAPTIVAANQVAVVREFLHASR
jgi:pimeloyl-ACP methyl ester carboxylesterase